MRQEQINVYKFDELSEEGKETAMERFRELDYEWYENVYYDTKEIGKILGIDIENIYFSHMYCQGSGACFEGEYSYKKGALKDLKAYAPQDEELHQIGKDLQEAQRKYFYLLTAKVKHSGHYYHENCTEIEVSSPKRDYYDYVQDSGIEEALRDFMKWIMKILYTEYEYLTSDEAIIETIQANEYEFDVDGNLY